MMIAGSQKPREGFHMTPDEMDAVFERHCAAELNKDAEHDVIGDPAGVLRGRAAIAPRYKELFNVLSEDRFESLRRYHGENFFVDESRFVGRVIGPFMGFPGGNAPVDFRILH